MADLPEIALAPVARPTDQYSQPAVQRKLKGTQALQLAAALKDFSSAGEEIFNRQFAAHQQNSAMQADQVSEQHQFKNMQDLKGAVGRGEIPMWANPWFQVRLKQDTARNEVAIASQGIKNDLYNSDTIHQDDPNKVGEFITQRYGQMMQGRDAWEVAAMTPEMDQAKHQMLSQWVQQRGVDRVREAHEATGTLVQQKLDAFDPVGLQKGDPAAMHQLELATADVQQQYDTLLHVTDKATASQWISDAVMNAARTNRNADVARRVLDNLKGQDGIKLSSLAENRANLERLPREIQELKNADVRAEVDGKQLAGVKERMAVMDDAKKWSEANPDKQIIDYTLTPEQFAKLSPEGYADFTRNLTTLSQEMLTNKNVRDQLKTDPVLGKLLSDTISGRLTPPERIPIMAALALNGEPGRQGVESFMRALNFMRDMSYGDTSPESMYLLNKKSESGTLTMNFVLDEMKAGHLDRHTAGDWMQMAARVESTGARYAPLVNKMVEELQQQVSAPYMQGGLLAGDNSKMEGEREAAAAAFRLAFYNRLVSSKDWDTQGFTEQFKQMQELKDSISQSFHGPDTKTWLANQKEFIKEPVKPRPTESPSLATQSKGGIDNRIDSSVVGDLSKMLKFNVEKPPLKDMLEWSSNNRDPLGNNLDPGNFALSRLDEYRKQTANIPNEKYADVNIEKATAAGSRVQFLAMDKEAMRYQVAQQKMQDLKPAADEAVNKLLALREQFNKTGSLTFEQQQDARQQALRYLAFQDLRQHVGYTANEVKEMGDGAWRSYPMFANPLDLQRRGKEAAKTIGLKDFQLPHFISSQLELMKESRTPATE